MGVRDRDPFVAVAATLNAQSHEDYKSSYLEIYISICSRAGTDPAKGNFCTCFPSIETIGEKFKHSPTTVMLGSGWLERNAYLFKERRRRTSNLYTTILRRDWFLAIRKAEGDDIARQKYKAWIKEQQAIAREERSNKGSDSASSSSVPQQSSDNDFKNARDTLEVPATDTSRTTSKKSQPLHLDLDPSKTITRPTGSDDLEPDLPLGPFLRRKIFD